MTNKIKRRSKKLFMTYKPPRLIIRPRAGLSRITERIPTNIFGDPYASSATNLDRVRNQSTQTADEEPITFEEEQKNQQQQKLQTKERVDNLRREIVELENELVNEGASYPLRLRGWQGFANVTSLNNRLNALNEAMADHILMKEQEANLLEGQNASL